MSQASESAKANVSESGVVEIFDSGSDSDRIELIKAVSEGATEIWVDDPNDNIRQTLEDLAYKASRDLYKMGRSLPLADEFSLITRPFVMGQDDAEWLEVNNAAFSWHREQGGWTQVQLEDGMAEDSFDANDFLVHEINGKIAGFCWTKVHTDVDPPEGEIFVIAAHPDHHGKGLGRNLTLAGLDHLARKGLAQAILYVDADNKAAVSLYNALGFEKLVTRRLWLPKS